jgi:hypothetical protein
VGPIGDMATAPSGTYVTARSGVGFPLDNGAFVLRSMRESRPSVLIGQRVSSGGIRVPNETNLPAVPIPSYRGCVDSL